MPPLTLGHEFAGTVVETGSLRAERRRRRLRLRREPHHLRRVLPVPHRPRAHVRAHAHPRRRPRRSVRALRRRARVGDLAERPRRSCRPRSRRCRSRSATRSSPPSEQDLAGRSVAVLGCGPIGLFTIGIARASGAASVVGRRPHAVPARPGGEDGRERDRQRRRDARRRRLVPRAERGLGFDVVFEMSGSPSAIADAFRIARNGGRVILFGIPVATGRDRRRRGADLQEPERAGAERPPDLRDLVSDALAAGERRRRPPAADHAGATARGVRGARSRCSMRARPARSSSIPGGRAPAEAGRAAARAEVPLDGRWQHRSGRHARRTRWRAELDALREAGTYKRFNTLTSPQGPVVGDGGPGRGARPLVEQLPRARRPAGGGRGRDRGAAPVRRRHRLRPLHLRDVRAAPRARARAGRLRRHRGLAHLRLLLERERGGDPDARRTRTP